MYSKNFMTSDRGYWQVAGSDNLLRRFKVKHYIIASCTLFILVLES